MVENSDSNYESPEEKSADEGEQLQFKDYLDKAFEKVSVVFSFTFTFSILFDIWLPEFM